MLLGTRFGKLWQLVPPPGGTLPHPSGSSTQVAGGSEGPGVGIDVVNGGTADCGIMDLLHTKKEAIKLATDAAVTVLRVDQIIMSKPAGGPKAPAQEGVDDD